MEIQDSDDRKHEGVIDCIAIDDGSEQVITQKRIPIRRSGLPAIPFTRHPSISFEALCARYRPVVGSICSSPSANDVPPKLFSREDSMARYSATTSLKFVHSTFETINGELYVRGCCEDGAPLVLKLLDLEPFCWSSTQHPSSTTPPTPELMRKYLQELNAMPLPPRWNHQRLVTRIEARLDQSTEYKGCVAGTRTRLRQWYYKLYFVNLAARDYCRRMIYPLQAHQLRDRPELDGCLNEAKLDWQPIWYQEDMSLDQMAFGTIPGLRPKTLIEVDARKVRWYPIGAIDPFGGQSDDDWTESLEAHHDRDRGRLAASLQSRTHRTNNRDRDRVGYKRKAPPRTIHDTRGGTDSNSRLDSDDNVHWLPESAIRQTRAILEGHISYLDLILWPDAVVNAPEMDVWYDIETSCGRQIQYTLQNKIPPPWPSNETMPAGYESSISDSMTIYAPLLSKLTNQTSSSSTASSFPSASSSSVASSSLRSKLNHPLAPSSLRSRGRGGRGGSHRGVGRGSTSAGGGGRGRGRGGGRGTAMVGRQGSVSFATVSEASQQHQQQTSEFISNKRHKLSIDTEVIRRDHQRQRDLKFQARSRWITSGGTAATATTIDSAVATRPKFRAIQQFPDANRLSDPITYIATYCSINGDQSPFLILLHRLRSCSPISTFSNVAIYQWESCDDDSRADMLDHWSYCVATTMNSLRLWHFNGINYDVPYQTIQASLLGANRWLHSGLFLVTPATNPDHQTRLDSISQIRLEAQPGRTIYREDRKLQSSSASSASSSASSDGAEVARDIDFPGVKIKIPGVVQYDVYIMMRQLTFNSMERGSLKEVALTKTKCRCSGWTPNDSNNGCAWCDHSEVLHCSTFVANPKQPSECKQCGNSAAVHDGKTRSCKCKKGVSKRDLRGEYLTPSFCWNDDTRKLQCKYNERDVHCTFEVAIQNQLAGYIDAIGSLTYTHPNDLITRGQTRKMTNLLVHMAQTDGWVLDSGYRQAIQSRYNIPCSVIPQYAKSAEQKQAEREADLAKTTRERIAERTKYTGAYVTTPLLRRLKDPAVTLDYNSLYPSIALAYRLCMTSMIRHEYDATGRLWFPMYGSSADDQDQSKFVVWHMYQYRPSAEIVGSRDLVFVVTDPGSEDVDRAYMYFADCVVTEWLLRLQTAGIPVPSFPHRPDPGTFVPPAVPKWAPHDQATRCPTTMCWVVNVDTMFPMIMDNCLTARNRSKKLEAEALEAGNKFLASVRNGENMATKLTANSGYGYKGAPAATYSCGPVAMSICLLGRLLDMIALVISQRLGYCQPVYGDTDSIMIMYEFLNARYSLATSDQSRSLARAWADVQADRMGPLPRAAFKTDALQKTEYDTWKADAVSAYRRLSATSSESDIRDWIGMVLDRAVLQQGFACSYVISSMLQTMHGEHQCKHCHHRSWSAKDRCCASPDRHQLATLNIELEKMFRRGALFYDKKKYAFLFQYPPKDYGKPKMQGLAGKRRDSNTLMRFTYDDIIRAQLNMTDSQARDACASFLNDSNRWSSHGLFAMYEELNSVSPQTLAWMKPSVSMPVTAATSPFASASASSSSSSSASSSSTLVADPSKRYTSLRWASPIDLKESSFVFNTKSGSIRPRHLVPPGKSKSSEDRNVIVEIPLIELKAVLERNHVTGAIERAGCSILKSYFKACEKLMDPALTHEDVQRTSGVKSGYTNVNLPQVQAIQKSEARRGVKFEIGTRVSFVMIRPLMIRTNAKAAYKLDKMYECAEETSYAELNALPIFRMYYLLALKKKIKHATSLILHPSFVDAVTKPFQDAIYSQDIATLSIKDQFRFQLLKQAAASPATTIPMSISATATSTATAPASASASASASSSSAAAASSTASIASVGMSIDSSSLGGERELDDGMEHEDDPNDDDRDSDDESMDPLVSDFADL